MRFFIALEIPDESKQELKEVQSQLAEFIPNIRLTNPEKLHLTIAFIGEQPETLKTDLAKLITEAIKDIPPFTVSPGIIDGFPNIHKPNTIWMGVNGQLDYLLVIRERVKDRLTNLGLVTDERRFVPHITLAKANGNIELSENQEQQVQNVSLKHYSPIKIASIKLFESIPVLPAGRPQEGFHQHNTLAEVQLGF